MSDDSSTRIGVISWPALWMYWPIYLALARTQQELLEKSEKIEFFLDELVEDPVTGGPVTDEAIRAHFYKKTGNNIPAIALCEPGEATLSPSNVTIRRIPALWRLPHWLLWSGRKLIPGETSAWAYPEKTTSGNFVRMAMQQLPIFEPLRGRVQFNQLPFEIEEERELILKHLSGDDIIATFTPWKVIISDDDRTKLFSSLTSVLLPGPSRGITAILLPDLDNQWTIVRGRPLAEYITKHLKVVLGELNETHGDPHLINKLLDRTKNFELTKAFLRPLRQDRSKPFWMDSAFLSPALGEYVRLGCYFPYRHLDAAVNAELRKRIDVILADSKEKALQAIQRDISEFFGTHFRWQELSFEERLTAWKTASSLGEGQFLDSQLTHPPRERKGMDAEHFLRAISVSLSEISGYISLQSLAPELSAECTWKHPEFGSAEQRNLCFGQTHWNGIAGPTEVAYLGSPCINCVVGGVPKSVVRPAAEMLARNLKLDVGYRCPVDKVTTFGTPCPVCFEDIEGLLTVFVNEARTGPSECQVVLYNGFNGEGEAREKGGLVLFGIWWRGSTAPGGGGRGAAQALPAWASGQSRANREVVWIGFWTREDDYALDKSIPDESEIIMQAKSDFRKDNFDLAYTAVFRVPAVSAGIMLDS